eukprot:CAMPEP_0115092454 /NCGR_PEP_ID=MMETSP0227-20121206/26777_1 /TAXON_ID=89957 /ORGANISM="Polarella glacialis, Strain CCMP 1383" /LENGTH=149 /DNA_ID=CAMNT_0002484279 /DNA_START=51 /DNA_END=500 /DNA_ORIENTATION=-
MATPSQNLQDIKDDVAHRLEASGALDQIRAQIRASVFRALLGSSPDSATGPSGQALREAPVQMVSVVVDFLENLELDMTREVFLRESAEQAPLEREELEKGLVGVALDPSRSSQSVLEQLVSTTQGLAERKGMPETIPEQERSGGDEEK